MTNYNKLIYENDIHTNQMEIENILIKEGFEWLTNCEIENSVIEIENNKLIWHNGIFHSGTWVDGSFGN